VRFEVQTMPLPQDASPVAFVFTADRAKSQPFYEQVLGLPVLAEDPFAVTFDLGGGATLRLTDIAGHQPSPHTVLGWRVDDIGGTVARLRENGVIFAIYEGAGQDDDGIWRSETAQVAWFHDPEGNNLSVTQFS
jgi:catechol 2,3-dioxygenase-like lactoylglutathione lyase family enzyme